MDGERYLRSSALRAPLFWAAERVLITSIALAKHFWSFTDPTDKRRAGVLVCRGLRAVCFGSSNIKKKSREIFEEVKAGEKTLADAKREIGKAEYHADWYGLLVSEHLLVGVQGSPGTVPKPARVASIFEETRGQHAKPQCVYQWIEQAFPLASKLEIVQPLAARRVGCVAWQAVKDSQPRFR